MKRLSFPLAALFLLLAILVAIGWYAQRPAPVALTPTLTGEVEYCQTCHTDLPEISPSHPVQAFGCVICHGGERLALTKDLAHSTLRGGKNPADLAVVEISCGGSNCHSGASSDHKDHIPRTLSSIQATYAGAIASVLYTFGAQPDLQAHLSAAALPPANGKSLPVFDPTNETSPPVIAFATNCLTCHLEAQPLPGGEYSRFTGCPACHTPTAGIDLADENRPAIHKLTASISYAQCNTCHNRGNYDLVKMEFMPRRDQPADRLSDYYQPIAQFTRCEWTLECVDCHTSGEAMGDGKFYNNKKEAKYIRCKTCHGTLDEPPLTRTITDPNDLALRLAFLNPVIDLQVGDVILVTEKGEPLWNTRQLPDETFELFNKASGQRFTFRSVQGTACQQDVDRQDSASCHTCHQEAR